MSRVHPWLEQSFFTVTNLIKTERLPGVILLHGAKGIGKKNFAQALARELIGAKLYDQNPELINIISKSESSIKVDDIRELISKSEYTSTINKVNIVLDIDKLTVSAANSLLKILETGLPNTYFILTTSNYSRILPTILSRSYKVELNLSTVQDFKSAINWLLSNGLGSNTDAKTLLDLANNGPLLALEYYQSDYAAKYVSLKQIIRNLLNHSSNVQNNIIVQAQKQIEELFSSNITKDAQDKITKGSNSANKKELCLDAYLLILNNIIVDFYKQTLSYNKELYQLIIDITSKLSKGIPLDSSNVIFNTLYTLVKHEKN